MDRLLYILIIYSHQILSQFQNESFMPAKKQAMRCQMDIKMNLRKLSFIKT